MFSPSRLKSSCLVLAGLMVCVSARAEEHKAYVQFNAGAAFASSYKTSESYQSCSYSYYSYYSNSYSCSTNTYNYKEDYDPGFVASAAVGYQIAKLFRIEFEGLYQSNNRSKYQSSETSNSTVYFSNSGTLGGARERSAFLFNAYYDFKNSSAFTPYISSGLGAYHLRMSSGQGSSTENALDFAWQTGAGINYRLDDSISLDLKYRYFGGADADFSKNNYSPTPKYAVGENQVVVGLRVGF